MDIVNAINGYSQNNYLNMDMRITEELLYIMLEIFKKQQRVITNCNIPKDFKFSHIILEYYKDIIFTIYNNNGILR